MNMDDAQTLAEQIDRLIKLNIMAETEACRAGWDTESIQRVAGMKCDVEKAKSDLAKFLQVTV